MRLHVCRHWRLVKIDQNLFYTMHPEALLEYFRLFSYIAWFHTYGDDRNVQKRGEIFRGFPTGSSKQGVLVAISG